MKPKTSVRQRNLLIGQMTADWKKNFTNLTSYKELIPKI